MKAFNATLISFLRACLGAPRARILGLRHLIVMVKVKFNECISGPALMMLMVEIETISTRCSRRCRDSYWRSLTPMTSL